MLVVEINEVDLQFPLNEVRALNNFLAHSLITTEPEDEVFQLEHATDKGDTSRE